MKEKESGLKEANEVNGGDPKRQSLETSPQREVPKVTLLPIQKETPKLEEGAGEALVLFENLYKLVGKNILFRDPHTQPNRMDDPYYKTAVIGQRDGKFVIVIDRGRYYPYYTGDRKNVFILNSQEDIDRYRVELEG